MYYLFLMVDGEMMEWGKSESFSNIMDTVDAIARDKLVKIVGPKGEWTREDGKPFKFTATV